VIVKKRPKLAIVEGTTKRLFGRVVDVLYIDKNGVLAQE